MKRALRIRQLKTSEELRRARLPCDAIIDILDDLATLPTTITDYDNILRDGAAVCSKFMLYSRGESNASCRLRDMVVDAHNNTLVNREKGGPLEASGRLSMVQQRQPHRHIASKFFVLLLDYIGLPPADSARYMT
eukprot:jgi/Tetstr1/461924/TSEL_007002.t1